MIMMSQDETLNWLVKHNISENNMSANYELKYSNKIPIDSGAKNYLAKEIASIYTNSDILLYINEFGIFPSSENMYLFDGYRKSIGINNSIYEKPTQIINQNEGIELYCTLGMILYFYMGCIIIPINNQDEIIKISHDEFLNIYVRYGNDNKSIINKVNQIMK